MPKSVLKPCANPGCPNLVVRGYCDVHKGSGYESQRPNANARDYGAGWRKIRDAFLRQHPWCMDPDVVHDGEVVRATDVDHILPREQGGSDRDENLEALCHSCHSRKTAKRDGGFGNKKSSNGGGRQESFDFSKSKPCVSAT